MEVSCEPAIFVKAKLMDATLHLTLLDQLRNFYYPSILFYEACSNQISEAHLGSVELPAVKEDERTLEPRDDLVLLAVRRSIEAMVEHYPWAAGRLRMVKQMIHSSLDASEEEQECLEVCINEDGGPGVQFVVAHVKHALHCLGDLSDPNPAFEPLFACVDENAPYHSRPLVALQVSRFECGGFSVSMSSNHVLFDGIGASIFLQNIGSCARGKGLCIPLDLAPRELRIHPRNPPSPKLDCSINVVHKKDFKALIAKQASIVAPLAAVTKFVFTEHDLTKLRLLALSRQEDCKRRFETCTRFQVIAAHVWKAKARCMMALSEDPSQEFSIKLPVNVREHIMRSIPKNYVGNAFGVATPSLSRRDLNEKSLAFVVEAIQDAIENVSPECFQSNVDHLQLLGGNACIIPPPMAVPYLANLGFYDIDFGWGKPTYFGRHFKQPCNHVIIMDGNAQRTSLNVFVAFDNKDELLRFQDVLKLGLAQ